MEDCYFFVWLKDAVKCLLSQESVCNQILKPTPVSHYKPGFVDVVFFFFKQLLNIIPQ